MAETVDSAYLGKLFDETIFEIERLARVGDIPKLGHGKYNLPQCIKAYFKYLKDPDRTVTAQVLAEYLGVTSRTIEIRARDGDIPKKSKGQYALRKGIKAYLAYWVKLGEGGDKSLTDERTRLTRFQADNEEMKNKELKAELIHVETALNIWETILSRFESKINSTDRKIAKLINNIENDEDKKSVIIEMEGILRSALDELSNIRIADYSRDRKSDLDIETPDSNDGKRVGRPKKVSKPRPVKRIRKVVNKLR